ncbi:VOC family protein [Saccharopolyspora sp. CA-218241]|uniref:VOC family protein n=1 Tax=Saccharopolyspora sp. CA-218241 TaxID=3240027 RepID=UPI003D9666F1
MEISAHPPGTPAWTDVTSPDTAASAAFYSGLFGWEVRSGGPAAGGYRICTLRGAPVAGLGPQFEPGVPPFWTTYFAVTDVGSATEDVRAAGGEVLMAPRDAPGQGRVAVLVDPTGAVLALREPTGGSGAGLVAEPGAPVWHELATRDPDKARGFYGRVFGWASTVHPGPVDYTEWLLGGRGIGGMLRLDDSWAPEVPAHWLDYFAVDDLPRATARVVELGGGITAAPPDRPVAVAHDPFGAHFGLLAPG